MRKQGLSYRQVQKGIFELTGTHLSRASISYWTRGIHNPSGSLNPFLPEPSPELSYVIGVAVSDGNINIHDYHREVLLSVTDGDFAHEFGRCLGMVLERDTPYKARWSGKRNRWIVQGSSVLLHGFLSRPWTSLTKWIEHCERCESAFLRAFYDGEGSISGRSLTVYNTNKEILQYVQVLLNRANIDTTPLRTNRKGRFNPNRP
jgi:intein-encoded DNA endonuclease-like protein